MGSLRVGHGWANSLSLFTFIHWRRKWQPTPLFLPGESQGRRSLVGYSPWGPKRVGHDWLTSLSLSFFIYLDFSVSSLFVHLCSISLPFHYYYYFTYSVWGLLFPGFKDEFFLPLVSALLRLVQWFLWSLYRVRFVLSCLFVCLFFLWWASLSEVVIMSVDDWVCIVCVCVCVV